MHPVTLSLLEGLGDLFSQHRGIVDFVYARIAGDPARGIPGILDRPATELLGPDSIYEHFAPRLAEISAFHAYPRRIVPHLDETIEAALESAEDRALARRLVRMLVLYKVHPTASSPTVSQLAELASCSLGAAESSLNVRYVSEAVLEPVSRASRFLVRGLPVSGDPLQTVYAIAVEQDPGKLFEARVRSAAGEIAEDDGRLLVEPLAGMAESDSWPGAAVWEEGARRSVSWNWSTRSVLVRFLQGEAPEEFSDRLAFSIAEEGFDFAVVIATGTASIAVPHVALWRVPSPKKSEVLREYLAVRTVSARLSPSSPADAPLIPLAKERIARIAPAAFQAALETLYAGTFADPRINVEPSVRQVKRFDRLLEAAAEVMLQERFPRFREVAPRKLAPSPRLYQQLLEGFVTPGSLPLTDARTRSLAPLIEGLAVPLGLVETRRGSYVFSPDSSEYPLIPHLLSLLSPSGPTPLGKVLAALQASPFGLPHDTAVFLVTALVLGGLLAARRSGRAIPLDYLTLQAVENAEEVTLGELISEVDREMLLRECVFLPSLKGVESFGLRQQREAWKDVIRFRESAQQLVADTRRSLGRIAEFSSFQAFGVEKVERTLSALSILADAIRVSYQAKEGLEGFLRAWRGTGLTSGDVLSLKRLSQFLQEKGEEFIFVNHYLRHPVVEKAAARDRGIGELRATALALLEAPEASVLGDGGEHLSEVFTRLRDAYGAAYAREHAAFYEAEKPPGLSRDAARSFEVLKSLAGIESLDRPPGLEALLGELAGGDRPACRRRLSEELLRSPVCGCGFTPGDAPRRPRASDPEKAIDDALRGYCGILAQPGVLEAVTARLYALRDASAGSAERLRKLAEILHRGGASPAELVGAVDGDTAAELGRALGGRVAVRQRSLGELAARLAGRRLPPRTILSLVGEWISEPSEEAIISVGSDVASPGGAAGGDPSRSAVTAADAPLAFWPLLHGDLFTKLAAPDAPKAGEVGRWERGLESAFPAARLRDILLSVETSEVLSFIAREGLHAEAVRAAWLVAAERIARGGRLPGGFHPRFPARGRREGGPGAAASRGPRARRGLPRGGVSAPALRAPARRGPAFGCLDDGRARLRALPPARPGFDGRGDVARIASRGAANSPRQLAGRHHRRRDLRGRLARSPAPGSPASRARGCRDRLGPARRRIIDDGLPGRAVRRQRGPAGAAGRPGRADAHPERIGGAVPQGPAPAPRSQPAVGRPAHPVRQGRPPADAPPVGDGRHPQGHPRPRPAAGPALVRAPATHARAHGRPRDVTHPHGALARTRRSLRADDLPRDLAPRLIPGSPRP